MKEVLEDNNNIIIKIIKGIINKGIITIDHNNNNIQEDIIIIITTIITIIKEEEEEVVGEEVETRTMGDIRIDHRALNKMYIMKKKRNKRMSNNPRINLLNKNEDCYIF